MLNRLHDPVELLQRKLERVAALTSDDRRALAALPLRVAHFRADQDIVRQADRTLQSCLLIQGLACSYKIVGHGKRQIVAIHLPGDMPDLQSLHLGQVDTTVMTMVPTKVAIILHEHLGGLFANPHIATALWRSIVADAAIAREWVANVGRRRAVTRTAHLLTELITRMYAIGAVKGDSFELPITQEELGDALGMSVVHVNRSLRALRQQGLISWVGPVVSILDLQALATVADFDADYLHFGATAQGATASSYSLSM